MYCVGHIIARAYRLLRRRGHVTRHLAKFKSRLKIVKSTVCIVQTKLQLLLRLVTNHCLI